MRLLPTPGRPKPLTRPEAFSTCAITACASTAPTAPRVAYGGDGLFYTWYDGTSWHRVTVDSNPGVGQYASLVLDLSDRPRIAYYDSVHCSLKFAYTNDTTPFLTEDWTVMYVKQPAADSACLQLPLADRVAKPLQQNAESSDGLLSPESTNAPSWDYPQGATGLFPSLTIDHNNGLHLSFYDTQVEVDTEEIGKLYYGYWDGESPWALIVVDHRNDVGSFSSIAVDNNNHPMISYLIEKYDNLRFCRMHLQRRLYHQHRLLGNLHVR